MSKASKQKKIHFLLDGVRVAWHPDDGPLIYAVENALEVHFISCGGGRSYFYNAEARVRRVHARGGSIEEMEAALVKPQRPYRSRYGYK